MNSVIRKVIDYVRSLPLLVSIGGGAVIVVALVLGLHYATRAEPAPAATAQTPHVTLSSVAGLSSQTEPLPTTGKVTSLHEATILAQTGGGITRLSKKIGDIVGAGEIIATFENSSQQASVLQAEGSYDGALAALAKVQGTTANNSGLTSTQAAQGAGSAQASLSTALQNTYAALDDAVHTKADVLFVNPRSLNAQFILTVPDNQLLININNGRQQLEDALAGVTQLDTKTSASIASSVAKTLATAQVVTTFLNDTISGVNKAAPVNPNVSAATFAGYQSSLAAGRSEVLTAVSALVSAKASYDSAQTGAATAANSALGTNNDIAAAQANVKQALGALNSARANLEKTIVRSPISGVIVSLPVTQGDFVSAFAQVAQVSNPGALQIETNVTPEDARTLAVGNSATVEGSVAAVIVSVASALDPTTNKVQVRLGLVGDQSALTDGETVSVLLSRVASTKIQKPRTIVKPQQITIPIVSAKITPEGPVVFGVEGNTLVAHSIVLGTLLGDKVVVVSGLTLDMSIVADARGLSAGDTVVVDSN
jgi:multidrug efflux pump subunit AcrA (membrane-fusion protein)